MKQLLKKLDKTDKSGISGEVLIEILDEEETKLKHTLHLVNMFVENAYNKKGQTTMWLKLAENKLRKAEFIIRGELDYLNELIDLETSKANEKKMRTYK